MDVLSTPGHLISLAARGFAVAARTARHVDIARLVYSSVASFAADWLGVCLCKYLLGY